jgi:4'-phosphopantetheinyl transferase EntD
VVRAVAIPDHPPPPEVLARLLPPEQAFAAGLPPLRLATWVAGRLALAAALAEVGAPRAPLLATPRGAPVVPPGFVGSVSHKRRLAAAIAAPHEGACLGLDVEDAVPHKYDITARILRDEERAAVDALAPDARWRGVIVRFSIKESIYKAVDPFVCRYVSFHEAVVDPGPPGDGVRPAAARLEPAQGEGPFAIEATWAELDGYVVSTARVRASG